MSARGERAGGEPDPVDSPTNQRASEAEHIRNAIGDPCRAGNNPCAVTDSIPGRTCPRPPLALPPIRAQASSLLVIEAIHFILVHGPVHVAGRRAAPTVLLRGDPHLAIAHREAIFGPDNQRSLDLEPRTALRGQSSMVGSDLRGRRKTQRVRHLQDIEASHAGNISAILTGLRGYRNGDHTEQGSNGHDVSHRFPSCTFIIDLLFLFCPSGCKRERVEQMKGLSEAALSPDRTDHQ
ncbi:MAG TPA: hypothetical protein VK881_01840, partial [bacterium]|nr:hypothetical protein [bacterium]